MTSATPIPFLDLVRPHLALEEPLVAAFRRALSSAQFVGGPEVEGFELNPFSPTVAYEKLWIRR